MQIYFHTKEIYTCTKETYTSNSFGPEIIGGNLFVHVLMSELLPSHPEVDDLLMVLRSEPKTVASHLGWSMRQVRDAEEELLELLRNESEYFMAV